jgi:hypothetical protein
MLDYDGEINTNDDSMSNLVAIATNNHLIDPENSKIA